MRVAPLQQARAASSGKGLTGPPALCRWQCGWAWQEMVPANSKVIARLAGWLAGCQTSGAWLKHKKQCNSSQRRSSSKLEVQAASL